MASSSVCRKIICHPYHIEDIEGTNDETGEKQTVIRMWCLEAGTSAPFVVTVTGFEPWCFFELPRQFQPYGAIPPRILSDADAKSFSDVLKSSFLLSDAGAWSSPWIAASASGGGKSTKKDAGVTPPTRSMITKAIVVRKRKLYYDQSGDSVMIRAFFRCTADMCAVARRVENASSIRTSSTRPPATSASASTTSASTTSASTTSASTTSASTTSASTTSASPAKRGGNSSQERGRFYGNAFGRMVLRAWEWNSVPTIRKFMTHVGLTYGGWFCLTVLEDAGDTITEPSSSKGQVMTFFKIREVRIHVKGGTDPSNDATWKARFTPLTPGAVPPNASKPTVLSFDIETYSSNHNAFPDPLNPDDVVYMISAVFQRAREIGTRQRFLICAANVLVDRALINEAYKKSSKCEEDILLDDRHLISVENECNMLDAFGNLVRELDPDIIIGYNTNGFDFPYLDKRYRLLKDATSGVWPNAFSRSVVEQASIKTPQPTSSGGSTKFVKFATIASLPSPCMPGRLCLDLLYLIRRDRPNLSKYTLEFVSRDILGDDAGGKHDVTPAQMFVAYQSMTLTAKFEHDHPQRIAATRGMADVSAYAVRDSEVVLDLFEKMNTWIGLVELASVAGVTPIDSFMRGEQFRIVSLLYNLAISDSIVLDSRKNVVNTFQPRPLLPAPKGEVGSVEEDDGIVLYTGGYVGDPVQGLHDNVICVDFSSLYPSIMIAFNISHDTLHVDSTPLERSAFSGRLEMCDDMAAAAAAVARPKPWGSSTSVVAAADAKRFWTAKPEAPTDIERSWAQSVYESTPSAKSSANSITFLEECAPSSSSTKKKRVQAGDVDDDEASTDDGGDDESDTDAVEQEEVTTKRRIGKKRQQPEPPDAAAQPSSSKTYTFTFTSSSERRGILPRLVAGLIDARTAVRAEIAAEVAAAATDSDETSRKARKLRIDILNQRQLAYKVTANATYGFIGAQRTGSFSLVEGAMSITAKGRQLIQTVNEYVRTKYNGKIIYGDTDSSMFILPDHIKSPAECHAWGERLAAELTTLFPPPLKLEFEKAMRLLCLKKKKYAALRILPGSGKFDEENIIKRGIVIARRDNAAFLREMYESVLRCILLNGDAVSSFRIIMESTAKSFESAASTNGAEFEIVKSLGASYKQKSFQMCVFADELARIDRPALPGDRIGYVIVTKPSRIPDKECGIKAENLGLRMRLTEWWRENRDAPIDVLYYIGHMCMNPIDQLFFIAHSAELARLKLDKAITFSPRKTVVYTCATPLKMLIAIVNHTNTSAARKKPPLQPMSHADIARLCRKLIADVERAAVTSSSAS
jgi:DNA polymerase elongation subunit (family B)